VAAFQEKSLACACNLLLPTRHRIASKERPVTLDMLLLVTATFPLQMVTRHLLGAGAPPQLLLLARPVKVGVNRPSSCGSKATSAGAPVQWNVADVMLEKSPTMLSRQLDAAAVPLPPAAA
jgi:hypothetical protein